MKIKIAKIIFIAKIFFLFALLLLFFILFQKQLNILNKVIISIEKPNNIQKYWVGGKYKLKVKKFLLNNKENVSLFFSNKNLVELNKDHLFMKSSGRECITAFVKKFKSTICFNIYNTPDLIFKEIDPIKIETNDNKQLNLELNDYPKSNIKYQSNHPDIIKVNKNGKITSLRPGRAIITASGLDNKNAKIKVLSVSNNGLINKSILEKYNVNKYNYLMIVSHPDDETLWGGANLLKDRYFVVCLTNGYNIERAKDFREILKFTNNSGIILNYPDMQDKIQDDWSGVRVGILKDLSKIINYKFWNKIVTHGPDGTTGHIHHKKTSQYVTKIAKQFHKYNNLYYFGKFYKKNCVPQFLPRIKETELEWKKKEVYLYKSVKKNIYQLWFHMIPYENWILASKWKREIV